MKVTNLDSLSSDEAAKALRGDAGGADCESEQVFLIGGVGGIACTLPMALRRTLAAGIETNGGDCAAGKRVNL